MISEYLKFRDEVSIIAGIIFKEEKLLVPPTVRSTMPEVHSSHLDVEQTMQRTPNVPFCPEWQPKFTTPLPAAPPAPPVARPTPKSPCYPLPSHTEESNSHIHPEQQRPSHDSRLLQSILRDRPVDLHNVISCHSEAVSTLRSTQYTWGSDLRQRTSVPCRILPQTGVSDTSPLAQATRNTKAWRRGLYAP